MQQPQPQLARASWEEIHKDETLFLDANRWQREAMETRVEAQDGFLVLIGLFVVLLLENLWAFESLTFASEAAEDAFLVLLVCGAACGVFAIFSMTMIRLKLQRLMVRDVASLKAQQVMGSANRSQHLRRLLDRWARFSTDRQFQPACLTYEWYHGGGLDGGNAGGRSYRPMFFNVKDRNPACPRTLVKYAAFCFAATVLCSLAALTIRIADTKGLAWSLSSGLLLGLGSILPIQFVRAGGTKPDGLGQSEKNPFRGF
ncbi:unnamed protein product [Scytosiphon promiscuus]